MDAVSDHGSAAKGLAIDLEVAGSGPVSWRFFYSLLFITKCSSLACLSFTMVYKTIFTSLYSVAHVQAYVRCIGACVGGSLTGYTHCTLADVTERGSSQENWRDNRGGSTV